MTDFLPEILTPDLILESAVDSNKVANYDPSGSDVLLTTLNSPTSLGQFGATVKSTNIIQPDAIASENILESISSPITNFINNISNLTNNYLGQNASLLTNSERISTESITNLLKENESSYTEIINNNLKETSSVLTNSATIIKDLNWSVENNRDRGNRQLETINNSISSSVSTSSSVLEKMFSPKDTESFLEKTIKSTEKEASDTSEFITSTESSILKILSQAEPLSAQASTPSASPAGSTVSNVSVRNNKLVESSEVKNMLAPDKTLENSVSVLSQTLPEAVNNLSTSVTSISPTSSTSNSNFVEGARIDQSTSTVFNQMAGPQNKMAPAESSPTPETNQSQTNEYYLQAIYSALMSGKIRVKLETY